MEPMNGHYDIQERVSLYRQFDEARQHQLDEFASEFIHIKNLLTTLQGDLDDERNTRRSYKKRAEDAETAIQRNQFALLLVDGDGYIFREAFLKAALDNGGAQAAYALYTEILSSLRTNDNIQGLGDEVQIMVNVYANRQGLGKALYEAGVIYSLADLDQFFCNFSRSQSLFQFVDCGYGKERVDAKIRDTYRFYLYNAQCRRVFLACTHDTGYVAELDKYRHDTIAKSKTTLIHAAQSAGAVRAYASLPFHVARFNSVFETVPLELQFNGPPRQMTHLPQMPPTPQTPLVSAGLQQEPPTPPTALDSTSTTSKSISSPPSLVAAALPTRNTKQPTPPPPNIEPAKLASAGDTKVPNKPTGDPRTGIPVNRAGQRIDLRMRQPTTSEQDRFDARIGYKKLCNEHHLRDACHAYSCKFDHDPIDDAMRNTLRYKARSIPCATGTKCRRLDCYYGHQCPWGNTNCTNPKCAFVRSGLHDIADLEVARFVSAVLVPN